MNRKFISVGIVAAAVIIAIFGFTRQMDSSLHTQKAEYAYFEDAIEVSGIVIRNEDVYVKEPSTFFESLKQEGDRIAAGSTFGTVYGKDAPKDIINSITEINTKISELRLQETGLKIEYDDDEAVQSRMNTVVEAFTAAAQQGDGSALASNKYELDRLLRTKLELQGKIAGSADELAQLENEKSRLEEGLSKSDVVGRSSGILTYVIDGFEADLTPDIIGKLSPDSVDAWLDYKPSVPEDAYSKIVSNNSWYYSFNITVNQLDNLKVGDVAYLKTTSESTDLIPVVVCSISDKSANDRVAVTVECSRDINSAVTNRKPEFVFVKKVYEGYKVPTTAVHVKNNVNGKDSVVGVYALMGGIVEFRPIKIVYSGKDYIMISNEYDEKTNRIRLYDEIIISTENIKEGMLFT